MRGDAYRTLLRSQGDFDLIVSEPSNPWVTGVEMLYSREFLEAARDRLTPGGVHAQWFHTYETDDETIALVLRTYQSVFEHAAVWFTAGADLLLIGLKDPEGALDVERLQRRFERPDFQAGFARIGIDSFPALLAHEILPVDVLAAAHLPGEIHTLLHPILSHQAARAFFTGTTGAAARYRTAGGGGGRNAQLPAPALCGGAGGPAHGARPKPRGRRDLSQRAPAMRAADGALDRGYTGISRAPQDRSTASPGIRSFD